MPHLFGATSRCLSAQPFQLLPSGNSWRHISLTCPFPHILQHTRWRIDITELFHWFCCLMSIWLSCYWAWLCWGYWHYRNLIDWLIDSWQQTFNWICCCVFYLQTCRRCLGCYKVTKMKHSLQSYTLSFSRHSHCENDMSCTMPWAEHTLEMPTHSIHTANGLHGAIVLSELTVQMINAHTLEIWSRQEW